MTGTAAADPLLCSVSATFISLQPRRGVQQRLRRCCWLLVSCQEYVRSCSCLAYPAAACSERTCQEDQRSQYNKHGNRERGNRRVVDICGARAKHLVVHVDHDERGCAWLIRVGDGATLRDQVDRIEHLKRRNGAQDGRGRNGGPHQRTPYAPESLPGIRAFHLSRLG